MARILAAIPDDTHYRYARSRRPSTATLRSDGIERLVALPRPQPSAAAEHATLIEAFRRDRPELAELIGL